MSGADGSNVTVIIPARNRAHLLPRAMASVWGQTTQPREIIVIDDGSEDDTRVVAANYGARVLRLDVSGGSGPARNIGIDAAKTEWIAFLDSDDEWFATHLASVIEASASADFVSATGCTQDGRRVGGSRKDRWLAPVDLLVPANPIVTSTVLARKETLQTAGLFRSLRRGQDLDLWLRVCELSPIYCLEAVTTRYHTHPHQISNDADLGKVCFDEIVNECATRLWMTPRVRRRSYLRVHWDEGRSFWANHDYVDAIRQFTWILHHPSVWSTLLSLLQARRLERLHADLRRASN